MPQKKNIEELVDETLNSLDGIHPVSPKPFFYTRLKARLDQRLNEKSAWETVSSFITRPVMMFATVCFVLLLNVVVLYKSHISSVKGPSADQIEQSLNDAYDVASNSNTAIYNIWSQDNDQHSQQ